MSTWGVPLIVGSSVTTRTPGIDGVGAVGHGDAGPHRVTRRRDADLDLLTELLGARGEPAVRRALDGITVGEPPVGEVGAGRRPGAACGRQRFSYLGGPVTVGRSGRAEQCPCPRDCAADVAVTGLSEPIARSDPDLEPLAELSRARGEAAVGGTADRGTVGEPLVGEVRAGQAPCTGCARSA